MKQGTETLLKFRKLMAELGWDVWELKGLLQSLWDFTGDNAIAGDIGKYSNEDIAFGIGYTKGNFENVIALLVKHRWLDQHDVYRLVVHDWHDHLEGTFKKRAVRGNVQFASLNITRFPPRQQELTYDVEDDQVEQNRAADNGGQRRTTADNGGLPIPIPIPEPSHYLADTEPKQEAGDVGEAARSVLSRIGSVGDFQKARDGTSGKIPPPPELAQISCGAKAGAALLNRIARATRDGPDYRKWWVEVVMMMDRTGGLDELREALAYVEKCADPHQRALKGLGILHHPAGYVASKCKKWLASHRLALPAKPEKANGTG